MKITVPVSLGELLDKISILSIKLEKITEPDKREAITEELEELNAVFEKSLSDEEKEKCKPYLAKLTDINRRLWPVQDILRGKEKAQSFDEEFIKTARDEYTINDERYMVKREINTTFGSDIQEKKSYYA